MASNIDATLEHCRFCFDVLLTRLKFDGVDVVPGFVTLHEVPLFITWSKKDKYGSYQLRGCIGCFEPLKLDAGLQEYSLASAFGDSRFNPISKDEVHHLKVSVSLLVRFEEAAHWEDWEVGVHGIRIVFLASRRRHSATYLPEVASEQGWTKREAMESLIRKAGYNGTITASLLESIKLTRYQSSKCSMNYDEYVSTPRLLPN